jgi:tetratricopeptide (TPR) repeat protein
MFFNYLILICLFLFSHLVLASEIPTYVGGAVCKDCHAQEFKLWSGSHHDLAMQKANASTVLGNFNDALFTKDGITSRFFKQGEHYMVNTDGPDGKLKDFQISYTFGVYPLQQYMVKFPEGKIQVLDIAWDTRTRDEGGQRWFSLHPDDVIKAGDVLHWTGPNLNWNYMCADCHSTNLKKNYEHDTKIFKTTFSEINVSCEACHGPGSKHIELYRSSEQARNNQNKGLTIDLSTAKNLWEINQHTRNPELKGTANRNEIELCAKCHSRRSQLDDDFVPGNDFRDHYLPSLLEPSLYYPDGKINDEVYVYGSFVQSKMYKAGVTCSDCHNAHTLKLKSTGDGVCLQCHIASDYITEKHHHHKQGSEGSQCIACHMPSKIYMGVDERNDHSFRIPRPDIADQLNIPDACTNCHKDKTKGWAAEAVQQWYGKQPRGYQQFSEALHGLEIQSIDALTQVYRLLLNDTPDIAKASAVGYLGQYPGRQTFMTSLQMLRSQDADTRRQALLALESFPIQQTVSPVFQKLKDPSKIVRLAAASILAAVPQEQLDAENKALLEKVTEEYRQSLIFSAERPESQLLLARLYQQTGQSNKAYTAYKEALRLQPQYVPAYVNYANYYQQKNNEKAAYIVLQKGLKKIPDAAAIHHSLGLWYVRNQEKDKALKALFKAAELEPDNARYQYVYAIALAEQDVQKSIAILERAQGIHPGNLEILSALVSYHQQSGNQNKAKQFRDLYEKVLTVKINPQNNN